jgi:hypothetical protein
MSLTVFLAFCILGSDFLLYVLFQWIYGEKHRKHARRSAERRERRRSLTARKPECQAFSPFLGAPCITEPATSDRPSPTKTGRGPNVRIGLSRKREARALWALSTPLY